MMAIARQEGAITVAIVNDINSPLAQGAEFLLPMHAGEERAVAATKSCLASLAALAHLTAVCSNNQKLLCDLDNLPQTLSQALELSWADALSEFKQINNTLVIARGFGFPIAQEAALKFKETSALQAEAFSAAEILHGPFALIKENHPYLLFAQIDATLNGTLELAQKITALKGRVILAIAKNDKISMTELQKLAAVVLPLPASLDAILDPLMTIQAFYPMVAQLAVMRGFNPDAPEHLRKVTETF
jgi:glucosamine--fructose-6-phosphate aminotransferase (isomerizing)